MRLHEIVSVNFKLNPTVCQQFIQQLGKERIKPTNVNCCMLKANLLFSPILNITVRQCTFPLNTHTHTHTHTHTQHYQKTPF